MDPIASSPQIHGSVGAASNLDANADVEIGFGPTLLTGLEADFEVQPTQPPHLPLDIDIPSGYPDVSGTTVGDSDTPDIADIGDFSVGACDTTCVCFLFRYHRYLLLPQWFDPKSFTCMDFLRVRLNIVVSRFLIEIVERIA